MSDAPTPAKADETTDLREALVEMAIGTRDLAREAQATADHFRPDFDACRVDGKFPDKAASDRSLRLYCFTISRERDAKRLTSEAETLERAVALIAAHAAEIQARETAEARASRDYWQVEARLMAAEANLIDLARMYGEACGLLSRIHKVVQRVALSEIEDEYEAMVVECEATEARAEAAEKERDEALAYVQEWRAKQAESLGSVEAHILVTIAEECRHGVEAAEARADWLAAENAVLKAALKPFAHLASAPEVMTNRGVSLQYAPDDCLACGLNISVADIRAARAALPEAITPKETSDVE